ncbi:hypothetical protein, partial [Salegentibacter sp. F14]
GSNASCLESKNQTIILIHTQLLRLILKSGSLDYLIKGKPVKVIENESFVLKYLTSTIFILINKLNLI